MQVKVKLSLSKPRRCRSLNGVEVQLHSFLLSELDGRDAQLDVPAALPPVKKAGTNLIGGRFGRLGEETNL